MTDLNIQLVFSIVAADPLNEGRSGVSFVKLGTEHIGRVYKLDEGDEAPNSVGEWVWVAVDGGSSRDEAAAFETGDYIGPGSRMQAAIALLDHCVIEQEARIEDRDSLRYESNGTVVVLRGAHFTCTECEQAKAASEFGLRRMSNGIIRNQAQCIACRSRKT